jgi:hypothetical protein
MTPEPAWHTAPGVVWVADEGGDLLAKVGALELRCGRCPGGAWWTTLSRDGRIDGAPAVPSLEAAKAAAIECARKVTREQAEALDLPPLAQAVVDAAVVLAQQAEFRRKLQHARGSGEEIALERSVRAYLAAKGADHE